MYQSLIKLLILLLLVIAPGCVTTRQQDSEIAKWMIPVNVAVAYFGSVGLHEAGHGLPAWALGAESVRIDMLPARDREGNLHLALTTYKSKIGKFNNTDFTIVNTMGPTAQLLGHISMREILKTNGVPRLLQPTIGWFGMFNQVGFYFHAINGLARNKRTDLGKEEAWVSGVLLGGGILYDIIDFLTEDKPENRLLVLFGEYYYEPKDKPQMRVISAPIRGGAFFGIGFDF